MKKETPRTHRVTVTHLSPGDPGYPAGLVKLWRDLVKCGGTLSVRPCCEKCPTGTYKLDHNGTPRCDECGHRRAPLEGNADA